MMRSLIILTLVAMAVGVPQTEADAPVPEVELSQATVEAAAHESIQALSEAGKSDTACRNMAKADSKAIEDDIKADQKLINALPTGASCHKHTGNGSAQIRAAKSALSKAKDAASRAKTNCNNAKKAPVKVGKIPLTALSKGKCSAVFGTAYKNAVKKKDAACAAQTAAESEVVAFQKALDAAIKEGDRLKKECECKAQRENKVARDALGKKDRKAQEVLYKKSKMMICVLDGRNTGHASCAPPLPKITFPKLPAAVTGAKCGPDFASDRDFKAGKTHYSPTTPYHDWKKYGNVANERGDMTVMIWWKATHKRGDWVRLLGKGDAHNRNYGLWIHPNGHFLAQIYGPSGGSAIWNKPIPYNMWTHMALTYKKNNKLILYVNGKAVASSNPRGNARISNSPVSIGYAGYHTTFQGYTNGAAVYHVAKSAAFIKDVVKAGHNAQL